METRGRKPKLKNPKMTSVIAEYDHLEFLKGEDINASEFFRESVEALMKSKSSPREILKKEIDEIDEQMRTLEILRHHKVQLLQEIEEKETIEAEEKREMEEFEIKRRDYIVECLNMLKNLDACNRGWLEHLVNVWKFPNFDEAKQYVLKVWIEEGVKEKKAKEFLKLK